MGFSESQTVCKYHPYHDQRLGVCPSCLREKLSRIYAVASYNKPKTAMDGASYSSSLSYSSASDLSPGHLHQRKGSDTVGSISFRVNLGDGLMKKSKSVAFISRNLGGEVKNRNKKTKGFWYRLLHLKEKKEVNIAGNGRLI